MRSLINILEKLHYYRMSYYLLINSLNFYAGQFI